MSEPLLGTLLSASNSARRFLRGLLADPTTTVADYFSLLGGSLDEKRRQMVEDSKILAYDGAMRDDPSVIAAKEAAEQRMIEDAVGLLGVGPAGITRKVVAPSAKLAGKKIASGANAGQIRGAPEGINTPQKLHRWRENLYSKVKEGAEAGGAPWYDNTSRYIYEITGGMPEGADRFSFLSSLYSQSNKVPSELAQTVRAWNQHLVGDTIHAGRYPNTMRPKSEHILNAPLDEVRLGIKTDPYALNKTVEWNPGVASQRSVIDRHMMSGFGYGKNAPTHAQNEFFNRELERVAERANREHLLGLGQPYWNLSRVQAAGWMPAKAANDTAAAVKKMVKSGKKPTRDEIREIYKRNLEAATKTFDDMSPDIEAQLTGSYIPAAGKGGSGHLPELVDLPYEIQSLFHEAISSVNKGPLGNDRLATGMGLLSRPMLKSPGEYQGLAEPDYVTRVLVGRAPGGTVMDESSIRALEAYAGARGLLDVQKQMAYNFSHNPIGAGRAEAIEILAPDGKPLPEAAIRELTNRLREKLPKASLEAPQPTSRGARLLNFDGGLRPEDAKVLRKELKNEGYKVGFSQSDRRIFPVKSAEDFDPPDVYSTRPFIDKVLAGGDRIVRGFDETVMDAGGGLARQQLEAVERAASMLKLTQAPWYKTLMEALATGGIKAADAAQKAGLIPAVALAFALGALNDEESGAAARPTKN